MEPTTLALIGGGALLLLASNRNVSPQTIQNTANMAAYYQQKYQQALTAGQQQLAQQYAAAYQQKMQQLSQQMQKYQQQGKGGSGISGGVPQGGAGSASKTTIPLPSNVAQSVGTLLSNIGASAPLDSATLQAINQAIQSGVLQMFPDANAIDLRNNTTDQSVIDWLNSGINFGDLTPPNPLDLGFGSSGNQPGDLFGGLPDSLSDPSAFMPSFDPGFWDTSWMSDLSSLPMPDYSDVFGMPYIEPPEYY